MGDYAWFKLLVRAIGVLVLGLSVPMVLWSISAITLGQLTNGGSGTSIADAVLYALPGLLGYGSQVAIGLYLLLDGKRLISMCLAGVRHRCAACGYNIEGIAGPFCPECGTEVRRPASNPPLA